MDCDLLGQVNPSFLQAYFGQGFAPAMKANSYYPCSRRFSELLEKQLADLLSTLLCTYFTLSRRSSSLWPYQCCPSSPVACVLLFLVVPVVSLTAFSSWATVQPSSKLSFIAYVCMMSMCECWHVCACVEVKEQH